MSLRKSSRSRNGSKSDVAPKPNARRRCTPAPSSVGLALISRLIGRMDMVRSLSVVARPGHRAAGPPLWYSIRSAAPDGPFPHEALVNAGRGQPPAPEASRLAADFFDCVAVPLGDATDTALAEQPPAAGIRVATKARRLPPHDA